MLPARWPRRRAHDLFHDRHARWAPGARAWFRALEDGEAAIAA
jgi:DNA-binding transcriptional regulator PaaX